MSLKTALAFLMILAGVSATFFPWPWLVSHTSRRQRLFILGGILIAATFAMFVFNNVWLYPLCLGLLFGALLAPDGKT